MAFAKPIQEDSPAGSSDTAYWSRVDEGDGRVRMLALDPALLVVSPAQQRYLMRRARKELVIGGRGGGKSHCPLLKMVYEMWVAYAATRARGTNRPGYRYEFAICAPTEKNYRANLEKLHDFIPVIPGVGVGGLPNWRFDAREKSFKLFGRNQLKITLVTLHEPDNVRGAGWDACFVDEAQQCDPDELEAVVFPMVFRPGFPGRITMAGSPNNGWFDDAAAAARDGQGYYGGWSFTNFTCYDNPLATAENAADWAEIRDKNEPRFRREYLGELHVHVPEGAGADCPITPELFDRACTMERIELSGPPLVTWDLMFGGQDLLVRILWNKAACALYRIDVWKALELGMTTEDPFPSLSKMFQETAEKWPGCEQFYDATGPRGGNVAPHVPGWVRARPQFRNNAVKNRQVEGILERMARTDPKTGKAAGIVFPSPDSPHLDAKQRENMARLRTEFINYRRIDKETSGRQSHYYTKGEGHGDDCMDGVTWVDDHLPPMRAASKPDMAALRARAFA